ncbi:MAG TPA: response regulator transcription factor [Candidatus Polarisedimenticolia bacterium]|nr:response regulator transcription factor [Candidatus Polarisedimenticolia bacterium]
MKRITVLLADDHLVVREGLRALLKAESDIEVVGEARDGRRAVRLIRTLLPEVVVMDIAMPLLNGLEATRQILKAIPATRVLVLSAHGDDEYVEQAIALGAAGYLIKQTSADLLARAIREVHAGRTVFSPALSRRLLDRRQRSPARVPRLSVREMEVLQLIAEGKANKQTAAEMGISIKTVEKHRQNLMGKLDIHDTAGLTRYAIAAGVIESSPRLTTGPPRSGPRPR